MPNNEFKPCPEGYGSYTIPLVCHEVVDFQQVQILSKQFAVHLEELQTDKSVRMILKLCKLE